ncbi:MAG: hypothetical protein ACXWZY_08210 [Gaiellaceae bacterium]
MRHFPWWTRRYPSLTSERTDEFPPDVRALLELVAERLNLGGPMARFVVDLSEGRVKFLTRQERITGTDLERS